ncbi:MAG: response regulator [Acidimicrobiales bacterium]|nr:response regulator [Acidimicrobiales bacterium]
MSTGTVLVVNDDRDAGELLVRLLERAGWATGRAGGLDGALGELDGGRFDAVVVDFLGAGIATSFRLLDAIRSGADAQLPVLILATTDTNRLFAFQSGADAFLTRPFHADELLEALGSATARTADERLEYRRAQLLGGASSTA